MSDERSAQAKRYNSLKIRLNLSDIFFTALYLVLFQCFVSSPLKAIALSFTSNFYCSLALYIIVFSFLHYIISFPMHFFSTFILEHRFELSNQRFLGWFNDDVKKGILSFFIFLIFIQFLYLLLRSFATTWWLWMALFWFLTTIVLARIAPVFIIPLFYRYYPVGDGLREKITELSKKCGIRVMDVYKIDFSKKTKKLNAAVVGLGKTRRVLLADNLIHDFTDGEINGVLAHEFGHHRLLHMWKMIIFGAISITFSFYILYLISLKAVAVLNGKNIYDIKIFPAFMLVLFMTSLAMMPLQNGFSRKQEKEADLFALKVTRDKGSFISLMRKLAFKNLADPNPSNMVKLIFYNHPPISERIKLAEGFEP
ncbi:MAG: hypothetical protein A2Z72_06670 [Omnitrophica bacterium RBG_13_46_9]|nr:MAG: hypothetical protein A2Z72_06670 [Omnitrophica bacterium RBG_13_46_9]